MNTQQLNEYINNYEILSHISASNFITTILKNFNTGVKINNIYNKNYELMLDIGLDIYIKNYKDKVEILNKIKNIFLYSEKIIGHYLTTITRGCSTSIFKNKENILNYLIKHLKQYNKEELLFIQNKFTLTLDLSNELHFNKYKYFIELVDEKVNNQMMAEEDNEEVELNDSEYEESDCSKEESDSDYEDNSDSDNADYGGDSDNEYSTSNKNKSWWKRFIKN